MTGEEAARAEEKKRQAEKIRRVILSVAKEPKSTIKFGMFITLVVAGVAMGILQIWDFFVSWNILNPFSVLACLLISTYYVFLKNFHQIEVGHIGRLLSFGQRTGDVGEGEEIEIGDGKKSKKIRTPTGTIFKEGYIWTLPSPIQDVIVIDLREKTERIDDKIFFAIGETDDQQEQAEMLVNTAIQWMVSDVDKFLDVGDDEVLEGMRIVVVNAAREVSSNKSPLALLNMKDELGGAIDDVAENQSDRWGIEILDVNIPYIRFANEETIKAFEKAAQEARQKEAGKIETENFLSIAQRFKEFGLDPDEAVWAAHRQETKVSGEEIHFSGNKASDFLSGLALKSKREK